MKRYKDWLEQSDEDMAAAKDSKETEHYEWACFQAQQSAEKSLKSLLLYLNIESWGHGLVHLLKQIDEILKEKYNKQEEGHILKEKDILKERCQELDRHYIQPRYPNGFASGHPAEYYNEKTANRCIEYAEYINKVIKEEIEELSSFQ
ncbi:MAG: HEPN domain-containing protein [Promethearchaeia archaeon]